MGCAWSPLVEASRKKHAKNASEGSENILPLRIDRGMILYESGFNGRSGGLDGVVPPRRGSGVGGGRYRVRSTFFTSCVSTVCPLETIPRASSFERLQKP